MGINRGMLLTLVIMAAFVLLVACEGSTPITIPVPAVEAPAAEAPAAANLAALAPTAAPVPTAAPARITEQDPPDSLPTSGVSQELPPAPETLEDAFPGAPYSPYVGRSIPTRVFWGDTHVHTSFSMDAGAFGTRTFPADVYRFAKGEELISATGQPVKLSRPLDFVVVADHTDNMGFFPKLLAGDPRFLPMR